MQKRIPRMAAAALGLALTLALLLSGCKKAAGVSGTSSSAPSSSAVSSSSVSSSSGAPSSSVPGGSPSPSSAAGAASSRASSGTSQSGASPSSAPAGKGGASGGSSSAPAAQTVALTIDATRGDDGMVASGIRVPLQSGDSVYSVLARYCKAKGILLAARKTPYGEYVAAIDGVAEFDKGGSSGWTFRVNGAYPNGSCDRYKPKPGDKVDWIYTTDGKNP